MKILLFLLFLHISFTLIKPKDKQFNTLNIDISDNLFKSKNISHFSTFFDFFNIPESVQTINSLDEILSTMASGKHRSCKASVLYHPFKKVFYFKNPSLTKSKSNPLKHYIPFKCKEILSRTTSLQQRFFLNYKDIEQIIDNNEDSILTEGIHEITELKKGFEISLFPVKFYKAFSESNYEEQKQLICYDSVKVLGIDKNNNDYLIISALDKHKIIHCYDQDLNSFSLNNFIRYSQYCDEFCAEDYIYFSYDLLKCKCDFYSFIDDFKKNKNQNLINSNSNNKECNYYSRKLDRYEIFANPYEIQEKLNKNDDLNLIYLRFYLHLVILIFTLQILYVFIILKKLNNFVKIFLIFYILFSLLIYLNKRLKFELSEIFFIKLFEVISDLYPLSLILFLSIKEILNKNDNSLNLTEELLKTSFLIYLNSFDFVLKETRVNEIELILRLIILFSTFIVENFENLKFLSKIIRLKLTFEFFSRFCLFFVENFHFSEVFIPFFIIVGRQRDNFIVNDHLLFQVNYLKLKPNFEKFYENWFLEALNFQKLKNMILFLKFLRYFFISFILSLFYKFKETLSIFSLILNLNFRKAIIKILIINFEILKTFFENKFQILNFFVFLSLLFINVFLTKDCFKLFLIHFALGLIMFLLSKNEKLEFRKNKKNNTFNNFFNFQDNSYDDYNTH